MKKKIKDTILSKKPKTLAISPVFAIVSSDSFSRDLARIIPRMEKGIAKEVKGQTFCTKPERKGNKYTCHS
ncbi:MAG: hypothetical protein PHH67_11170 [Methanosarcina sp.]|jgi:hypothetical protein|nr:hypothetical protein [Methanosarcina sp.]MDD3318212.1 hypothetical protein [Methanosarcina sp.]MDD4307041.1 hypothetical protein [Methanosarcina sp.]MDD4621427.1 hypothetical protein [Methanosarcina sp.]NLN43474.1 hypothetical protein [Methanosarcina sp.]